MSTGFEEADLTGAAFFRAALQEARFRGATLCGAKFSGANLNNAFFVGAILDDPARRSIARGALNWRKATFDPTDLASMEAMSKG